VCIFVNVISAECLIVSVEFVLSTFTLRLLSQLMKHHPYTKGEHNESTDLFTFGGKRNKRKLVL
jgi:hypothetical protein